MGVGLPVSSVLSTDAAPGALAAGALEGCAIVTPGTTSRECPQLIDQLRGHGLPVLVYTVSETRDHGVFELSGDALGPLVEVVTGSPVGSIEVDGHGLRSPVMAQGAGSPGNSLVSALSRLGIQVAWESSHGPVEGPVVTLSRHRGGLRLTSYCPDDTLRLGVRLPLGVPVPNSHDVIFDGSLGHWVPGRSFAAECRILVDQETPGVLSHRELAPEPYGLSRLIEVSGLDQATVSLLCEPDTFVECSKGDRRWSASPVAGVVTVEGVSGAIRFSW